MLSSRIDNGPRHDPTAETCRQSIAAHPRRAVHDGVRSICDRRKPHAGETAPRRQGAQSGSLSLHHAHCREHAVRHKRPVPNETWARMIGPDPFTKGLTSRGRVDMSNARSCSNSTGSGRPPLINCSARRGRYGLHKARQLHLDSTAWEQGWLVHLSASAVAL